MDTAAFIKNQPLIEARGVYKSYGSLSVLNNVDFDVQPGDAVGIVGPNGAGKTTLFTVLSGTNVANKGSVYFQGNDVRLAATFVVRILRPWYENLAKRQVKSPKVYIADSGLAHALLGLETRDDLRGHPKVGASWEGFLVSQVIRRLGARPDECYFWGTHQGAELDLLVVRGRRRLGFEFKRAEAPSFTPSMRIALADLKLDELTVVHAGQETWSITDGVRAVAARHLLREVRPLP